MSQLFIRTTFLETWGQLSEVTNNSSILVLVAVFSRACEHRVLPECSVVPKESPVKQSFLLSSEETMSQRRFESMGFKMFPVTERRVGGQCFHSQALSSPSALRLALGACPLCVSWAHRRKAERNLLMSLRLTGALTCKHTTALPCQEGWREERDPNCKASGQDISPLMGTVS